MTRGSMNFLKGMGFGVAAGMAVGAIVSATMCCCMKRRRHGFKYNMGKALHNMGELVDSMTGMF